MWCKRTEHVVRSAAPRRAPSPSEFLLLLFFPTPATPNNATTLASMREAVLGSETYRGVIPSADGIAVLYNTHWVAQT